MAANGFRPKTETSGPRRATNPRIARVRCPRCYLVLTYRLLGQEPPACPECAAQGVASIMLRVDQPRLSGGRQR